MIEAIQQGGFISSALVVCWLVQGTNYFFKPKQPIFSDFILERTVQYRVVDRGHKIGWFHFLLNIGCLFVGWLVNYATTMCSCNVWGQGSIPPNWTTFLNDLIYKLLDIDGLTKLVFGKVVGKGQKRTKVQQGNGGSNHRY